MPTRIPDRVALQLRINATLHGKLKRIAEAESRYLNSQIEYFLKTCVMQYEETHGPIPSEGGD